MKHWLLLAALICFGSKAQAQMFPSISLSTSPICSEIQISSSVPTVVFTSTPTPSGPSVQPAIGIYNACGSSIFCSQDIAVSSITVPVPSTHLGWPIPAASSYGWFMLETQAWNCIGGSLTAACPAVVCKLQ